MQLRILFKHICSLPLDHHPKGVLLVIQESKQQAVTCVTEVRDSPAAVLDGGGDRVHRVRAEGSQFTADIGL